MNTTYRVVIGGLKEGFSKDQVNANLANLFKTTVDKLPDISEGSNLVVKKSLDLTAAQKYQLLLEKQGCKCVIETEVDIEVSLDQPQELSTETTSNTISRKDSKFCRNCGYELPISAKFCRSCGSAQTEKKTEHSIAQKNYKQSDTVTAAEKNSHKQTNTVTTIEKHSNAMFIVVACLVAIVIAVIGYVIWTKNKSLENSPSANIEKPQSGMPDNARALKDLFGIEGTGEPIKTGAGELNSVWHHQDFKYGKNNMHVFFVKTQATDLETGQVRDCHACAPLISAITYKQVDDKWVLVSKNSKFIELGQWGDTPDIKGKLEELKIGPDNTAYLIDSGFMNQGESVMNKVMFSYDTTSGWREIGSLETSGGNGGGAMEDSHFYSYEGKVTSRIGKNPNYYDIVVVMTGTEPDYSDNAARPIKKADNVVYIYNGVTYEKEKISNSTVPNVVAPIINPQATVDGSIPNEFHGTWATESICQQLKAGGESDSSVEITSNRINRYEQYCTLTKPLTIANKTVKSSAGIDVYKTTCAACHASGLMGSPVTGNKDQWQKRIGQGRDVLVKNAINGIRLMPKRGGNVRLSDSDVESAVVYMANQSGANFNEVATKSDNLFSGEFSCNQEGSTTTESISLVLQSDGKLKGLFDNTLIKCN